MGFNHQLVQRNLGLQKFVLHCTKMIDKAADSLITAPVLRRSKSFRDCPTGAQPKGNMIMAAKSKPEVIANETAEAVTKAGADAMRKGIEKTVEMTKSQFEKAAKSAGDVASFNKETVEALVKSANATAKGVEAFNAEVVSYSKQSIEDTVAAAKAMMGARSVKEFVELHTDFSKTAFDAMVNQSTKMADLLMGTAKDAFEPIQSRAAAVVEKVQSLRPTL
jgi:phasin family protein